MKLSIIIPAAENETGFSDLLKTLASLSETEVLLCIPEGADGSQFELPYVRLVRSEKGRSRQMNAGAKVARGEWVWFLHADSKILKPSWILTRLPEINQSLAYFDLKFHDGQALMILNQIGVYLRSRIFKMPFGDQGFLLKKADFFKLGMFDERLPFAEDHKLLWTAKTNGFKIHALKETLSTSARKYQSQGWVKTTIRTLMQTAAQIMVFRKTARVKPSIAVVVFLKTPGLSAIKTRLARTIGEADALKVYELSVQMTLSKLRTNLQHEPRAVPVIAVAESEGLSIWKREGMYTVSQGEGNLGERLNHVYHELKRDYRGVILMGGDTPQFLPETILASVMSLIRRPASQIGLSTDGGYYFFGSNQELGSVFREVPTSTSDTARIFLEKLNARGIVAEESDCLTDLDEFTDFPRVLNEMSDHEKKSALGLLIQQLLDRRTDANLERS